MATGGAPEDDCGESDGAFAACSSHSKPAPSAGAQFAHEATVLFNNGWFGDAAELFTVAINAEPNNPYYYEGRSQCYSALGDLEEAYDDAALAVGLGPRMASCRLQLGKTQLALGMHRAARWSFECVLQANPELPEAREELQALMDRWGTDAGIGDERAEARDDRHDQGAAGAETGPETTETTPLLTQVFENTEWKRANPGGDT